MGLNWVFPSQKLERAERNKPSATQHASVIDVYLANEVFLGRVAGPFHPPPLPNLQISSFGIIPKQGQPGKWRLTVDLSSPGDGGERLASMMGLARMSLLFITFTVDRIVRLVSRLGKGALMAKFDVEYAYRNVPVHLSYHYLLEMKWRNQYHDDLALPFRLRLR